MALGDDYATLAELKSYLGIGDTDDDTELTDALGAASRDIENFCQRIFNDAGSATARTYYPDRRRLAAVDDFHTTTGLVVETDEGDDGTFETTWASTDYQLEPLGGVVEGQTGWPFNRVRAVESRLFPVHAQRATLQVTAQWGWASVPVPVKQACLIVAAETFKLKDAPFGIAGFSEWGMVRVRDNPKAARLLAPYRQYTVLVG